MEADAVSYFKGGNVGRSLLGFHVIFGQCTCGGSWDIAGAVSLLYHSVYQSRAGGGGIEYRVLTPTTVEGCRRIGRIGRPGKSGMKPSVLARF